MTTVHKGVRAALLVGLGAGFVALASAARQDANGADKKPEKKKTPAASLIIVEFTISVDGMAAVPDSSTVEFKGLNGCDASPVGKILKGQGKFRSLSSCNVELEIFIPGLNSRFAQVDVSKYQGSPVRIEIPKSSEPPKVTFPGPPPPTASPTK
jgi:hypothetical protein